MLFHGKNGYANARQCYVYTTLPVLFGFVCHRCSTVSPVLFLVVKYAVAKLNWEGLMQVINTNHYDCR